MTEPMTYLYAISREPPAPEGISGIGGEPVRVVPGEGITALVSTVDAADFGERGLREHLEDVRWLEETARAHNRVVDAARTPIAPLGLATVYLSDDRVREVLRERGAHFRAVLDRVAGRTEWGVKAYADPPAEETPPQEPESERPGAAYLQRARRRREFSERSWADAVHRAERLHADLAAFARASRVLPPQDRDLAGYTGRMLLNGAYLVDDERGDEFAGAVTGSADRVGLRAELTGPWPPYSFATLEDEENAGGPR
ncbi:MAG: GvpL/GvpF family gas vesicle protein [Saccharopolyspora sp.]|uniref:GvpL/GvpF family gas vesicle protein n=1 Tax=Saccharopolyspora TaxID=1835 RepID=UPI00190C2DF5|nr:MULTISPECIES: GvpL/GvpF family gas vesicle protein [unclassified Saccharopolyspora]MBK0867799.1 GvpL/GvpF family gas vesicle protein [Saccharopolyspora sp. HNM0986]MBQ6639513.1 GvpL/GvpF family gas vesicle protein [Saccharopolyspora sp.]